MMDWSESLAPSTSLKGGVCTIYAPNGWVASQQAWADQAAVQTPKNPELPCKNLEQNLPPGIVAVSHTLPAERLSPGLVMTDAVGKGRGTTIKVFLMVLPAHPAHDV
jgi:hypothetical protein